MRLWKRARIVKITNPAGLETYLIQQRHWLYKWWWVAARKNYSYYVVDTYLTIDDAETNLPIFDGSPWRYEVMETKQ